MARNKNALPEMISKPDDENDPPDSDASQVDGGDENIPPENDQDQDQDQSSNANKASLRPELPNIVGSTPVPPQTSNKSPPKASTPFSPSTSSRVAPWPGSLPGLAGTMRKGDAGAVFTGVLKGVAGAVGKGLGPTGAPIEALHLSPF